MNKIFAILTLLIICVAPHGAAQTYIQLVDSADYYIGKQNWKDAERVTVAALRLMPANKLNSHLWSNLGDIRTRMQDYDGALQAFEIGLAQAPNSAQIRCNRAYTLLAMKRTADAAADINEAIRIDSLLVWPRKMRATIALAENRYNEAESDFMFLKRHNPELAAPYAGLGKIEALRGNSADAIPLLEKALSIEHDEDTWFNLILLNIQRDKLSLASEQLHSVLKRYPRSGNMYLLRGLIHKLRFENKQAEADRKIAIDYGADTQLVEKYLPKNVK